MKTRDLAFIFALILIAGGCDSMSRNGPSTSKTTAGGTNAPVKDLNSTAGEPEEKSPVPHVQAAPVGSSPAGMDSSQYPPGASDSPH